MLKSLFLPCYLEQITQMFSASVSPFIRCRILKADSRMVWSTAGEAECTTPGAVGRGGVVPWVEMASTDSLPKGRVYS